MARRTRELTVDDVARIVATAAAARDRAAIYACVEAIAAETVGFVFLTTLKQDEARQAVVRVHSSNPQAYPVGGEKPYSTIKASQDALDAGEVFLAPDRDAVKAAYFDHETIFALGSTAILNAPIRFAGRRLGTLNFCGEEHRYGPAEVRTAQILAGLLVPALLAETGL